VFKAVTRIAEGPTTTEAREAEGIYNPPGPRQTQHMLVAAVTTVPESSSHHQASEASVLGSLMATRLLQDGSTWMRGSSITAAHTLANGLQHGRAPAAPLPPSPPSVRQAGRLSPHRPAGYVVGEARTDCRRAARSLLWSGRAGSSWPRGRHCRVRDLGWWCKGPPPFHLPWALSMLHQQQTDWTVGNRWRREAGVAPRSGFGRRLRRFHGGLDGADSSRVSFRGQGTRRIAGRLSSD
jgi:hypothetical protein